MSIFLRLPFLQSRSEANRKVSSCIRTAKIFEHRNSNFVGVVLLLAKLKTGCISSRIIVNMIHYEIRFNLATRSERLTIRSLTGDGAITKIPFFFQAIVLSIAW